MGNDAQPARGERSPADDPPNVVGRQPFGRIHVANSDAAASANTNAAIDEGHRAVAEIVGSKESENAV